MASVLTPPHRPQAVAGPQAGSCMNFGSGLTLNHPQTDTTYSYEEQDRSDECPRSLIRWANILDYQG